MFLLRRRAAAQRLRPRDSASLIQSSTTSSNAASSDGCRRFVSLLSSKQIISSNIRLIRPQECWRHHHNHHHHHHHLYSCRRQRQEQCIRSISELILPPGKGKDDGKEQTSAPPNTILPGVNSSIEETTASHKKSKSRYIRSQRRRQRRRRTKLLGSTKGKQAAAAITNDDAEVEEQQGDCILPPLDNDNDGGNEISSEPQQSTSASLKTKDSRDPRGAQLRMKKKKKNFYSSSRPKKGKNDNKRTTTSNSGSVLNDKSIEQALQQWYESTHSVEFKETCVTLKKMKMPSAKGHFTLWTAQFQCPITKESFSCGKLKNANDDDFRIIDGQICYFKMAKARAAAIARALDFFQCNDGDEDKRVCVELSESQLSGNAAEKETSISIGKEPDDETDDDSDAYTESDDDDDEEYTIEYLPGTASTSQEILNPMARVIGTWGEAPAPLSHKTNSTPSIMTSHPERELQRLIKNAQDWIEQEKPKNIKADSEHRVMLHGIDSPRTLEIGKSILAGLAKANHRVTVQESPRGVENIATKILNYLWSTPSAQPTPDVYASYIGCLEGPDPISVAKRAKTILEDMENQEAVAAAHGHSLPKPNIQVINAVIQACSQIGGESGRYDLETVDGPNRESFLSALSSMNYPPSVNGEMSGFDPIFAEQIIAQMRELSDDNPMDSSLKVDTQVYNAGLRWSGGLQSTLTRPYMRRIPWDPHAEIFREGFQQFDEDSEVVQNAYRMHAWLEEMAGLEDWAKPDIETYEAVVQAYVRTGTLEGVEQAEKIIESLMDSPTYRKSLRMQTFHPVIAAWTYSGHERGPERVNKWAGRLEDLVDEGVELELDGRIQQALVLANSSKLIKILEGLPVATDVDHLIDIAYGCSVRLKELCSKMKNANGKVDQQSITLLDANIFVLVIDVWGRLGLHRLKTNWNAEELYESVEKMNEAIEEFEAVISVLHRHGPSDVTGDLQLRHLMGNSHKVYAVFLESLQGFQKAKEKAGISYLRNGDWSLENQIHDLERGVRRINEFVDLDKGGNKENEAKEVPHEILYQDLYIYPLIGSAASVSSVNDFVLRALQCLKDDFPSNSRRRGDMLRLCFLMLELLPASKDRQNILTGAYKQVVDVICHLAASPHEKEALLLRVVDKVVWLRDEVPSIALDYDAVIREIEKHSNLPKSSTGRSATRQRRRRSTSPNSTDTTAGVQALIENEV